MLSAEGAGMWAEISRALGRIEGQVGNIESRLDDASRTTDSALNALRQDVVHANTEVRRQVTDHEARIKTLENDKIARGGAFKLVALLKEYAPWMVGILLAVLAWMK